jgi:uncharacterized protein
VNGKSIIELEDKRRLKIERASSMSARLPSYTLLSVADLEARRSMVGDVSTVRDWKWTAYEHTRLHATKPDFPCFFAAKAFEAEAPIFLFSDSIRAKVSRAAIARSLREYLSIVTARTGWEAASSVLFVVFKPHHPIRSLGTYQSAVWQLLRHLHLHDPGDWPIDTPTDLDDPDWSFCFGGIPIFVNISCPANHLRRSRNLGDSLNLVMQPRVAFDEIAGNTPAGLQVRKRIRTRIQTYDLIGPSPALGAYGDPANREWAQYGLDETNKPIPTKCPYQKNFKRK